MAEKYIVEIERPDGVSIRDMEQYIFEAVGTWRGQFEPPGGASPDSPGDPLWFIRDPVSVLRLTDARAQRLQPKFKL